MRALFLTLLFLLLSAPAYAKDAPVIQVSAKGTVKVQPDTAILNLSITHTDIEADTAIKNVNKQVQKLINRLNSFAMKEGSLDSSNTMIQADYDYQSKPRQLLGYRASRQVSFQLIDLAQLESLIQSISTIDMTSINNISFTVQNLQKFEDMALINAIDTAKHKADTIASALNIEIKGVYKVNHQVRHSEPVYARALMAPMDMEKSTSYEQKDIDVSTNIDIEFEIKEY